MRHTRGSGTARPSRHWPTREPGRRRGDGEVGVALTMSDVNPVDYIAEALRAILEHHPKSRIEELMPWQFRKTSSRAA